MGKNFLNSFFFLLLFLGAISQADNFIFQWSSYTTYFRKDIDDRGINIENAARYLDGFTLWPKTIFSFNEDVTSNIPQEHLGVASILSGERITPGFGGGLCQVSSTLYAASLYSGLSIYERKGHSKPVSYIPPGLDATVSKDDGSDLKIFNPYNCQLLIRAAVKGNCLTVSIWGPKPKPREVKVILGRPERIENFIYTTTQRHILTKGKVIFSEIVSRDKYIISD
ncbi:MAG: VanW family protein [Candidatus Omnitrophica bacterium]|nr:VanW family protein [Candidatus Omnitrophota bacterium]